MTHTPAPASPSPGSLSMVSMAVAITLSWSLTLAVAWFAHPMSPGMVQMADAPMFGDMADIMWTSAISIVLFYGAGLSATAYMGREADLKRRAQGRRALFPRIYLGIAIVTGLFWLGSISVSGFGTAMLAVLSVTLIALLAPILAALAAILYDEDRCARGFSPALVRFGVRTLGVGVGTALAIAAIGWPDAPRMGGFLANQEMAESFGGLWTHVHADLTVPVGIVVLTLLQALFVAATIPLAERFLEGGGKR